MQSPLTLGACWPLALQVHTRKDAKYSLKASYLEIYNEGVYDLVHFNPKAKSLPVKWDASYGFYVQGLKVVPCSQQRTMMEVRRRACRSAAGSSCTDGVLVPELLLRLRSICTCIVQAGQRPPPAGA